LILVLGSLDVGDRVKTALLEGILPAKQSEPAKAMIAIPRHTGMTRAMEAAKLEGVHSGLAGLDCGLIH
jgi:hypothetical protein